MYAFIRGPLAWVAFIIFISGCLYRLIYMLKGAKKDKVVLPHISCKHSIASLVHWLIPFNSTYMRQRPLFTIISFTFHVCLLVTPLFLLAHIMLWDESWGIRWEHISDKTADWMTLIVIAACIFFLYRRLTDPVVKNVTDSSDYILLAITALPFITGFIAYHQWFHYKTMLILHILSGEIMLIAIPFTRLSHIFFFFFTRAYFGSESGYVRRSKDW